MHKRLLTLLTILSLSTALLIGCGSKQEEPAQAEATTETVEVSEETTTPKETVETTPEVTEEPAPEPTEEPAPEPTEEPAPEPTEEPAPEPTEEPAPEPIPEPQAEYTYTDMTATMYATQTVNVRNLPSTDGEKIGSLSQNQEVSIKGQCNETNWYMFDYNGQTAFVSNKYLSTEKVEVQQSAPEPTQTASNVPNPFTVERRVVHDMGTYRFLVCSYYDDEAIYRLDPYGGGGYHLNTSEDLWCWVRYDDPWDPALQAFIQAYICHCGGADHNGLYPERLGN